MFIFKGSKRINNLFISHHKAIEKIFAKYDLKSENEAFVYYCLEHILKISEDGIKSSITYGEKDGGIDAVYINDKGIHILVCDYAESARQFKNSFSENKIEKSVQTMYAIFSSTLEKDNVNEKLQHKIIDMHKYWNSIPGTYIPHTIYFLTNKKNPLKKHERIEKQLNYFMTHSYYYMGFKDFCITK